MLAIDTNVVVRYVTGDHPTQSARAKAVIDSEDVFVCTTVVLETEWVLRSAYGFAPARIAGVLRAFAGLPHVTVENPEMTALALEWAEGGMDFADALHLTKAAGCEAFLSFDRRFARAADKLGTIKVRVP
ncbi:MAG: type II toxin-antitoxin system VapC family toxin [Acetobacteraceae bacterium]|nr:type II toxin-antitoxin system VapC family toxin [Acetobacteraceae bacterium]